MCEETKLILEMVKEGKINADEAATMLDLINDNKTTEEPNSSKPMNKKFLKIMITVENETTVNINVPVALAEIALKMVPEEKLKVEGVNIDIKKILQLIDKNTMGELVNIDTIDKGKRVKVKVVIS